MSNLMPIIKAIKYLLRSRKPNFERSKILSNDELIQMVHMIKEWNQMVKQNQQTTMNL